MSGFTNIFKSSCSACCLIQYPSHLESTIAGPSRRGAARQRSQRRRAEARAGACAVGVCAAARRGRRGGRFAGAPGGGRGGGGGPGRDSQEIRGRNQAPPARGKGFGLKRKRFFHFRKNAKFHLLYFVCAKIVQTFPFSRKSPNSLCFRENNNIFAKIAYFLFLQRSLSHLLLSCPIVEKIFGKTGIKTDKKLKTKGGGL
jgi:hypothetical protein